jgi:hypothetical protein
LLAKNAAAEEAERNAQLKLEREQAKQQCRAEEQRKQQVEQLQREEQRKRQAEQKQLEQQRLAQELAQSEMQSGYDYQVEAFLPTVNDCSQKCSKPTSTQELMQPNSIVDEYGFAILAIIVSVLGSPVIRFFLPHTEGISWWLLFASMPAALLLIFIVAAFGLGDRISRNNDAKPSSNQDSASTHDEIILRRLIVGLIVYWCATFIPGVIIESQIAAQAAIPRHWQPERDTNLTTTFTTNGLEYTLSASHPHSRILIDILDSSGKIIGTFGVRNPDGRSPISGTAELPRHAQLRGATAAATRVPSYAVTQCRDGWFSKSIGRGTCSHHGGEWRSMYEYFR